MSRVKRGTTARARHKSVLNKTKGFRGRRRTVYRLAKQAADKAQKNAKIGRKLKKRDFRALWIVRINAACRQNGIKYSKFIAGAQKAKIEINRKELSELALKKPEEFKKLVEKAKAI